MTRRTFSLIEVLISISIAAILFGILFSKVKDFVVLRKEIAFAEKECLERQTLQIRLEELFTFLIPTEKKGGYFAPVYLKNQKLCFQTEKLLDIEPAFATELFYTLYLDPQTNSLVLLCRTAHGAERKESLCTEVQSCSFHFFSEKELTWQNDWAQASREIPSYVQIIYKKRGNSIEHLVPVSQKK